MKTPNLSVKCENKRTREKEEEKAKSEKNIILGKIVLERFKVNLNFSSLQRQSVEAHKCRFRNRKYPNKVRNFVKSRRAR